MRDGPLRCLEEVGVGVELWCHLGVQVRVEESSPQQEGQGPAAHQVEAGAAVVVEAAAHQAEVGVVGVAVGQQELTLQEYDCSHSLAESLCADRPSHLHKSATVQQMPASLIEP